MHVRRPLLHWSPAIVQCRDKLTQDAEPITKVISDSSRDGGVVGQSGAVKNTQKDTFRKLATSLAMINFY